VRTRRQHLVALLSDSTWSFDDLRRELAMTVGALEEDLGHISRSVRNDGQRLRVEPAACADCGFRLSSMALHPPGRCPKCRGRHLDGPWISIS
jgi:predicted Zn-ribbon and HTH transcriptional regulator